MKGYLLAGLISVVLTMVTIRAIRKRQLTEMLAILWLGVSLVSVALALILPFSAFTSLAHFLGIAYPPDMILVFGMFFLSLFTFRLSIALSRLATQQKVLVQELAIMRAKIESTPSE